MTVLVSLFVLVGHAGVYHAIDTIGLALSVLAAIAGIWWLRYMPSRRGSKAQRVPEEENAPR